jgi:hypothetical protein
MASSKSTVVGIRLDHERRAWIEAEAARLGISVRGLFEGMIDEARFGDAADVSRAIAGLGSASSRVTATPAVDGNLPTTSVGAQTSDRAGSVNTGRFASPGGEANGSSWPGLDSVRSAPSGVVREAFSLAASLIKFSGRCATMSLDSCALTRRWSQRSL